MYSESEIELNTAILLEKKMLVKQLLKNMTVTIETFKTVCYIDNLCFAVAVIRQMASPVNVLELLETAFTLEAKKILTFLLESPTIINQLEDFKKQTSNKYFLNFLNSI